MGETPRLRAKPSGEPEGPGRRGRLNAGAPTPRRDSTNRTRPSSKAGVGNLVGTLRYALRQFWVARVFTATAVLTLALGIGGTTAIFSLIHAVMLRSLPVGDPSRLYRIGG